MNFPLQIHGHQYRFYLHPLWMSIFLGRILIRFCIMSMGICVHFLFFHMPICCIGVYDSTAIYMFSVAYSHSCQWQAVCLDFLGEQKLLAIMLNGFSMSVCPYSRYFNNNYTSADRHRGVNLLKLENAEKYIQQGCKELFYKKSCRTPLTPKS